MVEVFIFEMEDRANGRAVSKIMGTRSAICRAGGVLIEESRQIVSDNAVNANGFYLPVEPLDAYVRHDPEKQ